MAANNYPMDRQWKRWSPAPVAAVPKHALDFARWVGMTGGAQTTALWPSCPDLLDELQQGNQQGGNSIYKPRIETRERHCRYEKGGGVEAKGKKRRVNTQQAARIGMELYEWLVARGRARWNKKGEG